MFLWEVFLWDSFYIEVETEEEGEASQVECDGYSHRQTGMFKNSEVWDICIFKVCKGTEDVPVSLRHRCCAQNWRLTEIYSRGQITWVIGSGYKDFKLYPHGTKEYFANLHFPANHIIYSLTSTHDVFEPQTWIKLKYASSNPILRSSVLLREIAQPRWLAVLQSLAFSTDLEFLCYLSISSLLFGQACHSSW